MHPCMLDKTSGARNLYKKQKKFRKVPKRIPKIVWQHFFPKVRCHSKVDFEQLLGCKDYWSRRWKLTEVALLPSLCLFFRDGLLSNTQQILSGRCAKKNHLCLSPTYKLNKARRYYSRIDFEQLLSCKDYWSRRWKLSEVALLPSLCVFFRDGLLSNTQQMRSGRCAKKPTRVYLLLTN